MMCLTISINPSVITPIPVPNKQLSFYIDIC